MPKKYSVLRVFVASPSDVTEERDIVKRVVDELNQSWSGYIPVMLEFVGWETVPPGMGSDPQDVINTAIDEDYDIFIGILWTRFGTPTPRAGSGTEEEFQLAYRRYSEKPKSVQIMVYFSDMPPVALSQVDPHQLALVNKFRNDMTQKGVFYHVYKSREDFGSALRIHLTRRVLEWSNTQGDRGGKGKPVVPREPPPESPAPADPGIGKPEAGREKKEEEEGFLDLLESGSVNMAKVVRVTERMTEAQGELTSKVRRQTQTLKATKDTKQWKRIIDSVADDVMHYVIRMNAEIPIFADVYSKGLDSYSRAVLLLPKMGSSDVDSVQGARQGLQSMHSALAESDSSIGQFRESIDKLPPASTRLNKAKISALATLDSLSVEWKRAIGLTEETDELYADIIAIMHRPEDEH